MSQGNSSTIPNDNSRCNDFMDLLVDWMFEPREEFEKCFSVGKTNASNRQDYNVSIVRMFNKSANALRKPTIRLLLYGNNAGKQTERWVNDQRGNLFVFIITA